MEEDLTISKIISKTIELLQEEYPEFNIKLLTEKMYRMPPSEYAKAGHLGVDMEILGVKVFMGHELHAEDMLCHPLGDILRKDFVYGTVFKKYKTTEKITEEIIKRHNEDNG